MVEKQGELRCCKKKTGDLFCKRNINFSFCEIFVLCSSFVMFLAKFFPQSRFVLFVLLFFSFVFVSVFFTSFFSVIPLSTNFKQLSLVIQEKSFVHRAIVVSFALFTGIYVSNHSDIVTKTCFLIPQEKTVAISGIVISDLKNFGEEKKLFTLQAESIEDSYQNKFSAKGKISVVVSNSVVEGRTSFLISSGLKVFLKGKYNASKKFFVVDELQPVGWNYSVNKWRASCRTLISRILQDWGESGALLYALLTSSRDFMTDELKESFTITGCSHVIALSGMHASLLCGLAASVWAFFRGKKRSLLFGIAFVGFFCWFAGGSPSLRRSFFMLVISGIGVFAGFKIPVLSALLFSFFLQTFFFPEDSTSASFWLSYSGVLGLVLFSKPIQYFLSPYLPGAFAGSVASGIAAQISTSTFSVYYFGIFVPIGIFASIPVCFLIVPFMIIGAITLILEYFLFSLSPFLIPSSVSIEIIEFPVQMLFYCIKKILEFFMQAPILEFTPSKESLFGTGITSLFCFIIALTIMLAYKQKIKRSGVVNEFARL